MVEVDRVLAPIYINYEGNVDVNEIYVLVKKFLGEKKYDIDEKEHNFFEKKHSLKMKWEATQDINDYVQIYIEITINGSDIKKVKLKDRNAFSGKFKVEIEARVHKDYQDYYENKPIIKFFREFFDYLVKPKEFNELGNQVRNEAYALFDEIKAYFGIMKL